MKSNTTMNPSYERRLSETLPQVHDRIAEATDASGREFESVRLIAVTKAHPVDAVSAALAAGLTDLGENRVEELEEKVREFGRDFATWHMIGHLQSRKARRASQLAHLIQSVDSVKLANRISKFAQEEGITVRILTQVNTSGEHSKSGFNMASAVDDILCVAEFPGIRVEGLMTMAPFGADDKKLISTFRVLRKTHEKLRTQGDVVGPELSMGMTNDFEIAIREGSTMVRVGTALFGART
jgi:pyridoxal phosphate enzyme (YggS family)